MISQLLVTWLVNILTNCTKRYANLNIRSQISHIQSTENIHDNKAAYTTITVNMQEITLVVLSRKRKKVDYYSTKRIL